MEFIIGTLIGIVGIIIAFPQVQKHLSLLSEKDTVKLMSTLCDKSTTDKQRRKTLKQINKVLRKTYKKELSKEYLSTFELKDRGKEAVFEDICKQNKLNPDADICKFFLGFDSKIIRNRWVAPPKKNNSDNAIDITDSADLSMTKQATSIISSNKDMTKFQSVYISELLETKYPIAYTNLVAALAKYEIVCKKLKATKDIWCRDYMPVQTPSGKLVQFQYNPWYLQDEEYRESRSDVKVVCQANKIEPFFSNINMDGGNVLICESRALVSDRIFGENPHYKKEDLIKDLETQLECTVIIIPTYTKNDDFTGHVDGMVRWLDKNSIIGNKQYNETNKWCEAINKELVNHGIRYIEGPFFLSYKDPKHRNSAIGVYINYLEIGHIIFVPVFEVDENRDTEVIARLEELFPDRIIEPVNFNEVANEGGILNCATWTIFE